MTGENLAAANSSASSWAKLRALEHAGARPVPPRAPARPAPRAPTGLVPAPVPAPAPVPRPVPPSTELPYPHPPRPEPIRCHA